jgi:hypothetical protein
MTQMSKRIAELELELAKSKVSSLKFQVLFKLTVG